MSREAKELTIGTAWSEKRKEAHSEEMKEVWNLKTFDIKWTLYVVRLAAYYVLT